MRPVDLIVKKRDGGSLSQSEIDLLVKGFSRGDIPDYQISALLMAVVLRGLDTAETGHLTRSMIASGETIDLSGVGGPLVDKHSTGGVGDKISLVLAPLAAACGLKVPMMSGRSLGHTGGTLDKLESIPGYRTDLDRERFVRCLQEVGYAMIGQSEAVVPADRKMYALRDVTGTVESIPLITASILSKKYAEGAKALVFDVKCGSGAFMKERERAQALANSLVAASRELGLRAAALITDMDEPLGRKVGNFLEVEESIECLRGRGPTAITDLSCRLAGWMLVLGDICGNVEAGQQMARQRLADGSAWKTFLRNVEYQGGDVGCIHEPARGPRARIARPLVARERGFVTRVDAHKVGLASVLLGAGRSKAGDPVSAGAGVTLKRIRGEEVEAGQELCIAHGDQEARVDEAMAFLSGAFQIGGRPPGQPGPLVLEEVYCR